MTQCRLDASSGIAYPATYAGMAMKAFDSEEPTCTPRADWIVAAALVYPVPVFTDGCSNMHRLWRSDATSLDTRLPYTCVFRVAL